MSGLVRTTHQLSYVQTFRLLLLVTATHTRLLSHTFRRRYLLRFGLRRRHFGFFKALLPHRLRNQPEHTLNRPHQRIAGKDHE